MAESFSLNLRRHKAWPQISKEPDVHVHTSGNDGFPSADPARMPGFCHPTASHRKQNTALLKQPVLLKRELIAGNVFTGEQAVSGIGIYWAANTSALRQKKSGMRSRDKKTYRKEGPWFRKNPWSFVYFRHIRAHVALMQGFR